MSRTFAQTPLTAKQVAILKYLRDTVWDDGPQSCAQIEQATGYKNISSTLQSLKFRGMVGLGKSHGRMVVLGVTKPRTRHW